MRSPPGAGLGLKPEHFDEAVRAAAPGLWFEVHPENYLVAGGPRLAWLEAVRARHPLALHSVSLSLAGEAPPDVAQLRALAALVRRVQPVRVSEHLAWSRWEGGYLPDLLPFARTTEALQRIASHVAQVQDALGLAIALENPSHYLRLPGHTWDEIEFLQELARRTGCTLLLDVNNVHVSARNLGFDAVAWLDRFPHALVSEVHLAGHSTDAVLGEALLIDSHDAPVAPEVWALYRHFVARSGPRPTLVERDGKLPAFDALMQERALAHDILRRATLPQAFA
ncbi:MNIO family bufferin maturase [Ramlibacter sp. AN1133]|uniref:MNIO family bufferin maturase n=1 Tax=Ramlibacter sp. AN1133 TaxID=3133429 RepID=UPI0030C28295